MHSTTNLISRTQLRCVLSKFYEKKRTLSSNSYYTSIAYVYTYIHDTYTLYTILIIVIETNRIRDAINLIHTNPARISSMQLHYIHIQLYNCGYIEELRSNRSHSQLIIIMVSACYTIGFTYTATARKTYS